MNNSVKTTVHFCFGWGLFGSFVKYETLKYYVTFDEGIKEAGEAVEFKTVQKKRYKTVKKRYSERHAVRSSNWFNWFCYGFRFERQLHQK